MYSQFGLSGFLPDAFVHVQKLQNRRRRRGFAPYPTKRIYSAPPNPLVGFRGGTPGKGRRKGGGNCMKKGGEWREGRKKEEKGKRQKIYLGFKPLNYKVWLIRPCSLCLQYYITVRQSEPSKVQSIYSIFRWNAVLWIFHFLPKDDIYRDIRPSPCTRRHAKFRRRTSRRFTGDGKQTLKATFKYIYIQTQIGVPLQRKQRASWAVSLKIKVMQPDFAGSEERPPTYISVIIQPLSTLRELCLPT